MKEFCLFWRDICLPHFSKYLCWVSGETALLKGKYLNRVIKPQNTGLNVFSPVVIHFL